VLWWAHFVELSSSRPLSWRMGIWKKVKNALAEYNIIVFLSKTDHSHRFKILGITQYLLGLLVMSLVIRFWLVHTNEKENSAVFFVLLTDSNIWCQ
jgi:hypothetical protein